MEIVQAAGVALVAMVLILLLRKELPAYAMLALAAAMLLFLGLFAAKALPLLEWLEGLGELTGQQEFLCLIRAAGIALVAQCAQELCEDADLGALGYGVELTGRCLILAAGLPLLRQVLERLMLLMQ